MSDFSDRDVIAFTEALQLPPGDRAAYLDRECAGDVALRRRVENLLRAHESAGEFLAQIPPEVKAQGSLGNVAGEKVGDRIGHYKLLQQIGEGGCGIVYMADQELPVKRRVALKILKPGMDTKSVIARFEAERQALALMEHPNIAKVFDAGATEAGRPFFVMELVRGIKITDFCDQSSLTTTARLDLFIQVCRAIQHAHHKGVIHRDIKPSNILVATTDDGTALPKVIDFGIAKATSGQRLTDKTLFTAFEMMIGTPAYMSPEQAALTSLDVDTRTDIYSLGILLYELLTGKTPFDTQELLKAGLDEVRRVIRMEEPVRPSTRLSTMIATDLTTVARFRRAEPPKLIRLVRGDLDWIVMKALEKDRARRYQTPTELAEDLRHFLAHEPVSARSPGTFYKLQKLVRRNKLLCASITVIGLLLLTSVAIMAILLSSERRAREESDAALVKADQASQKLISEVAKSRQIKLFLEDMLKGISPSEAGAQDTTLLKTILNNTDARIGKELTNQPEVRAEILGVLGPVWKELGEYDKAEPMLQNALAAQITFLGETNQEVAGLYMQLAALKSDQGKQSEAEILNNHSYTIQRALYGDNNLKLMPVMHQRAILLERLGKLDEAESLARQVLAILVKQYGSDSTEVASCSGDLGNILENEKKFAEAEAVERQALDSLRKKFTDGHVSVAEGMCNLGDVLRDESKLPEAEAMHRDALQKMRKILGDHHPYVINAAQELVLDLQLEHKYDQIPALQDFIQHDEALRDSNLAVQQNSQAESLAEQGRWKDAIAFASRAVNAQAANHVYYHTMAPLLVADGELEPYRKSCREMVDHFEGTTDPYVADRMGKDCLILPLPGMDLQPVDKLTETAVTIGKDYYTFPFFCCSRALAKYRMARYPEAVDWALKSLKSTYPYVDSEAYAVLAMSSYQLKNYDNARNYLVKDQELVKKQMPAMGSANLGQDWRDWIISHALLKEAQDLIPVGQGNNDPVNDAAPKPQNPT